MRTHTHPRRTHPTHILKGPEMHPNVSRRCTDGYRYIDRGSAFFPLTLPHSSLFFYFCFLTYFSFSSGHVSGRR